MDTLVAISKETAAPVRRDPRAAFSRPRIDWVQLRLERDSQEA